jgi:hypothetical protein
VRDSRIKQSIGERNELPHQGAASSEPQARDRRRRRANFSAFEVHVPPKNNDKYDKNVQNIRLQEKLLINKIVKMSVKYFEYPQ